MPRSIVAAPATNSHSVKPEPEPPVKQELQLENTMFVASIDPYTVQVVVSAILYWSNDSATRPLPSTTATPV